MGRPPEIQLDGRDALFRVVEGARRIERSILNPSLRFYVTASLAIFSLGDQQGQRRPCFGFLLGRIVMGRGRSMFGTECALEFA
jgi:hypothetical protein